MVCFRSFGIVNPTSQLYSFDWTCEDEVDPKKPSAFRCLTPKGQIRSGKKSIVSISMGKAIIGLRGKPDFQSFICSQKQGLRNLTVFSFSDLF